jgi:hypothetical protein
MVLLPPMKISLMYSSMARLESPTYGTYLRAVRGGEGGQGGQVCSRLAAHG